MLLYLVVLLLLFLSAFVFKSKPLGWMVIFFMFMMSMFRGKDVSTDTIEYISANASDMWLYASGIKTIEIVNLFVVRLQPYLGNYVLIWFYSIVLFLFIILSCRRFNVNAIYAFFFFILIKYFNLSFEISRQFAASAVLLYAYSFLIEKNKKRFWFFPLVLFAIGIHSSSIVFTSVFFLRNLNLSKINPYLLVSFIVFIFVIMRTYAQPFIEWANMYSMTMNDDISQYQDYFNQADEINRSFMGMVASTIVTIMNVVVLWGLSKLKGNQVRIISLVFFMGIIISSFFDNVYGNLGRVRYGVSFIYFIAYAYFFMHYRSKFKPLVLYPMILIYVVLYIWDMNSASSCWHTVPYSFMF